MILPNETFCLGHEINLTEGENRLPFQGKTVVLQKQDGHVNLFASRLPEPWAIARVNRVLWLFRVGSTPSVPKLDFQDISGHVEYEYESEFKYVMENLYDLNHVAGTHARTLFAKESNIKNFETDGKTCRFDFRTVTDLDRVATIPLWRKVLGRILRGNDGVPREQSQPIAIHFPGFLALEAPLRARRKKQKDTLPARTYVAIYPMSDTRTKIVVFTQSGLPKWLLATLRRLRPNAGTEVFAEDGNILENVTGEYERKIRLDADTPVDYARKLYTRYST